jgi:hypothetical protein
VAYFGRAASCIKRNKQQSVDSSPLELATNWDLSLSAAASPQEPPNGRFGAANAQLGASEVVG